MQIKIKYQVILFTSVLSMFTGCTTLGPHSGSVASRSAKLSSGLQKAYRVSPDQAQRLSPMIIQNADQYTIPPLLIAAMIKQESGYNSYAVSPTGAVGLTQIIPSYWQQTCGGNLMDEATNIQCNAKILNNYHQQAGSWFKAVAYYNVGPTGYKSSFWTRHKAKKYARAVMRNKKALAKEL
ncbi:transglycosylase SLT domain-containing protein [Acinetobacter sp.]|uniref:lytic transglycosylase domain-containing protein n=1 Tax=Acinetobacter sp. TaxID=472 RepID=UPI0031CE2EFA